MKVEDFLAPDVREWFESVEKARHTIKRINKLLVSPANKNNSAQWRKDLINDRERMCECAEILLDQLRNFAKLTPTHPLKALP